jgi:hypothetical protein
MFCAPDKAAGFTYSILMSFFIGLVRHAVTSTCNKRITLLDDFTPLSALQQAPTQPTEQAI